MAEDSGDALTKLTWTRKNFKRYSDQLEAQLTLEASAMTPFPLNLNLDSIENLVKRVNLVQHFHEVTMVYQKLEKLEISGVLGVELTAACESTYERFKALVNEVREMNTDFLDFNSDETSAFFATITARFTDIDTHIASYLKRGYYAASTLVGAYRHLFMVRPFLERPIVKREMNECFHDVIGQALKSVNEVKATYDVFMNKRLSKTMRGFPPNYPQAAATDIVMRMLRCRLNCAVEPITRLDHPVTQSAEAQRLWLNYEDMANLIYRVRRAKLETLHAFAPKAMRENLKRNLLTRFNLHLEENFSDELVSLLKEIHNLQNMELPESGCEVSGAPTTLRLMEQVQGPLSLKSELTELVAQDEKILNTKLKCSILVEAYNNIIDVCLPEEHRLIQEELNQFDDRISPAIDTMTWATSDLDFMESNLKSILDLQMRVKKAQENRNKIAELFSEWNKPIFQHRRKKHSPIINFNERDILLEQRYRDVSSAGQQMEMLVAKNLELFKADPNSDIWLNYVRSIERIITQCLSAAAFSTLKFIETVTVTHKQNTPLVEAGVDLKDKILTFSPGMNQNTGRSLLDNMNRLMDDVIDQAALIPPIIVNGVYNQKPLKVELSEAKRINGTPEIPSIQSDAGGAVERDDVEAGKEEQGVNEVEEANLPNGKREPPSDQSRSSLAKDGEVVLEQSGETDGKMTTAMSCAIFENTYMDDVLKNEDVRHCMALITANTLGAMTEALSCKKELEIKYKVYWLEDRGTFIKQFCRYGRLLTSNDLDYKGEIDAVENPPTLEQFRAELSKYSNLIKEVKELPDRKIVKGWLSLELNGFKSSMTRELNLWSDAIKQYLLNYVEGSLASIQQFIEQTNVDLSTDNFDEIPCEKLVKMIERMRLMRSIEDTTSVAFEPLKETTNLLRDNGEVLSHRMMQNLEAMPEAWSDLSNTVISVKQRIQGSLEREVIAVRERSLQYERELAQLHQRFLQCGISQYKCKDPYNVLDSWRGKVDAANERAEKIRESAKVFEVRDLPNYLEIKKMSKDLVFLKQIWDLVLSFRAQSQAWKDLTWKDINFAQVEFVLHEYETTLKQVEKENKKLNVYLGLQNEIKGLLAAMSAIHELQNPAIKSRHWEQLMSSTGKKIEVSDDMRISMLISLNLHQFEDKVSEIVSKATNEAKIERELAKINTNLSDISFTFVTDEASGTKLPKQTSELVGVLEESQAKVHEMFGNRDNANSIELITYWYETLKVTDEVLTMMFDVIRLWKNLFPIFNHCEDIKTLMPRATQRFTSQNRVFQRLLKDIVKEAKVIKSLTTDEDLLKNLTILNTHLSASEKALSIYLESKRLAFPRFYFVSKADLMSIISLGQRPKSMMKHMGKLFDSINELVIDKTSPHARKAEISRNSTVLEDPDDKQHELPDIEEVLADYLGRSVSKSISKSEENDEHFSHEENDEHFSHEENDEHFSHEKNDEHISHEENDEHFSHEKNDEHFSHEGNDEHFSHEKNDDHFSHEENDEHSSHEENKEHFSHEKNDEHFSYEKNDEHFSHEENEEHFSHEENGEQTGSTNQTLSASRSAALKENNSDEADPDSLVPPKQDNQQNNRSKHDTLEISSRKTEPHYLMAKAMKSKDGEIMTLFKDVDLDGQVEAWLNRVLEAMRKTILEALAVAVQTFEDKPRAQWISDCTGQVALTASQIGWNSEVQIAFARIEDGLEHAMKDFNKKQVSMLSSLITMLLSDLTAEMRQKVMTLCTIDVHNRDVVQKLIAQRVESINSFVWISQLRHRWDEKKRDCFIDICDAVFGYVYEYLGNKPRLVVTPLTDRCYITLTQSLHLCMSGAPAGPAGTGKTETTKDLGCALGQMVYVFNCSEQMDYKSIGNIYKGLVQCGAWGCFDEFNRISVEVLSVVAVQVKAIQDAIRGKRKHCTLLGQQISLNKNVGLFITMNPGYAGRTELPENLKALFRPCAMVVPDFELITEIMLVAEGFLEARVLSKKFMTLYTLCKELLSKQDQYDWGLRSIKSVLVVAGALKRGSNELSEQSVLMRALRDFNMAKIIADDVSVFQGLIKDLFPQLEAPRNRNLNLEKHVKEACQQYSLQAEDNFVLKVTQLAELFEVRHSVFILGYAGTGKTKVWRTLYRTLQNMGKSPKAVVMDPKAVSNANLFGYINSTTREWVDGLLSHHMRQFAEHRTEDPQWIVLDGDIDPMWIESLNTVMDDNKTLTLASNERIPVTPSMRLLFEIDNLRSATPATVSRAGILYINPGDLGWLPFVSSWLEQRELKENKSSPLERATLTICFDKYVPPILEVLANRLKKVTAIPDIAHVQMVCFLYEAVTNQFKSKAVLNSFSKEQIESLFVFCCIWGFGGSLLKDTKADYQVEFNRWWLNEFKVVKFPAGTTIFEHYWNIETLKFEPWKSLVSPFKGVGNAPLPTVLVPIVETTRIHYFMDLLLSTERPILLVGNSGSGKSIVVNSKLRAMPEDYLIKQVPFNFYTNTNTIEDLLDSNLEKKSGKEYAPPGQNKMILFIDDLNMPNVDDYNTVQAHTIIRQLLDHKRVYNREKLTVKSINNVRMMAAMNPAVGNLTVSPRLQRHFCTFALNTLDEETTRYVYRTLVENFLTNNTGFAYSVKASTKKLVEVVITIHQKLANTLLATATKFHYNFNMRDLANTFQGMFLARDDPLSKPKDFVLMIQHELHRTYLDKLISPEDVATGSGIIMELLKSAFPDMNIETDVPPHWNFLHPKGDYHKCSNLDELISKTEHFLQSYNDELQSMNLVLFLDAVLHVTRICRILMMPQSNALLVGIGGSGKQSLSRLAAYIADFKTSHLQMHRGFNVTDLMRHFKVLCTRCGLKGQRFVFILSDSQIVSESFLVLVNDFLSNGDIQSLFKDDERDQIIQAMRGETQASGVPTTDENCYNTFVQKLRINLRDELRKSLAAYMGYVHQELSKMSAIYEMNERRYNYTTPKSFLAQIALFKKLVSERFRNLAESRQRFIIGVERLKTAGEQAAVLKEQLAEQEVVLGEKNKAADELVAFVTVEQEKVSAEKEIAGTEEAKVAVIRKEVEAVQKEAAANLRKAEPALQAAQEALNTLNKGNLTELKALGSPPPDVITVLSAVMILFAPNGKIPKDLGWNMAKSTIMSKIDTFLNRLINYDKEHMHPNVVTVANKFVKNRNFDPEIIRKKSLAAAGICSWVINILKFHEVYQEIKPKIDALAMANAQLTAATDKLNALRKKLNNLEKSLSEITKKLSEATEEKTTCQKEADFTAKTLDLANRLVNGFASERVRWAQNIEQVRELSLTVPGDVLLVTSIISYFGNFRRPYRLELLNNKILPYLNGPDVNIPRRKDVNPFDILLDDATIAGWLNQDLPNDVTSIENAAILKFSDRWPLMIDPQLQAVKWIKAHHDKGFLVTDMTKPTYHDDIEQGITKGMTVLIENIDEVIDPILFNVISRTTSQKGACMQIGNKEVPYDPRFRLILHTKLANPRYEPEIQAEVTLIDFTATRDGLEEQLLALVVSKERPDLEQLKSDLTHQQNEFKITMKRLEDSLLERLSKSDGNFLGDHLMVENLEKSKITATDIALKSEEAKRTEVAINQARESYRCCATRAVIIYTTMINFQQINSIYQFSLKAFRSVFNKAIEYAVENEIEGERINNLIDSITHTTYMYIMCALFEKDKLIYLTMIVLQFQVESNRIPAEMLQFLLKYPVSVENKSPVDMLNDLSWAGVLELSRKPSLRDLDKDILASTKRWKRFLEHETPETQPFPQEWKAKTDFEKLCMLRALRPDRMTYALRQYAVTVLGKKYMSGGQWSFEKCFEDASNSTPIFFLLSSGVDPLKEVEALGTRCGYSIAKRNFHNISLGQGQEEVAEQALAMAAEHGHWVFLQNIHLVARWLPRLDWLMAKYFENSHTNMRVFFSAEPAPTAELHVIPQGILENSTKLTSEAPTGMSANLHRALNTFTQETLERSTKETEFKVILFTLCFFHAVVTERNRFGPIGWNKTYPFNTGDLSICQDVLYNYLENNSSVPWEDLRYLFGEIMYGGHITDDWDRRLCNTLLQQFFQPDLTDGEMQLAPQFYAPPNLDIAGYENFIDTYLPPETPHMYGLHPNAEVEILTTMAKRVFGVILELQPAGRSASTASNADAALTELVLSLIERVPDSFNMAELNAKQKPEDRSSYTVVALQECTYINNLLDEITWSLNNLKKGLSGEQTMSPAMERVMNSLTLEQVPEAWSKKSYASLHPLSQWFSDLAMRVKELESWTHQMTLPASVWLGGLFNPQSFLTAVMQQTARKNDWPLDMMCISIDVTKKSRDEMGIAPREGSFVHGFYMDGARWDISQGCIVDAKLMEISASMPVCLLKAVPSDRMEGKLAALYTCPCYMIKTRGIHYVWKFHLKTKEKPSKWIMAGVALLLQI